MGDETTGEADALAHAAREFLRIGRLEAMETYHVDGGERAAPRLVGLDLQGLKTDFDVLQHR